MIHIFKTTIALMLGMPLSAGKAFIEAEQDVSDPR